MIQIEPNSTNVFVIYADTISNSVDTFGDYFLIGFLNGFTKYWSYVVPNVISRNSRYIKFSINTVGENTDDPINGSIYLGPSGNWDYKVWNKAVENLSPTGILIDEGQMVLLESPLDPELDFISYVSDNEKGKAIVYQSSNIGNGDESTGVISFVVYANDILDIESIFLLELTNGFTKEPIYVVPIVAEVNDRFAQLEIVTSNLADQLPLEGIIYLNPMGNWDYKVFKIPSISLDPEDGILIYEGQRVLRPLSGPELSYIGYQSDNETAKTIVYVSGRKFLIWNTTSEIWSISTAKWGIN